MPSPGLARLSALPRLPGLSAVTPAGLTGVAEGSWWPYGLVRKDLPDLQPMHRQKPTQEMARSF